MINENSYFYWQRKLRKTACEKLLQNKKEKEGLIPYGFTEVKLTEAEALCVPVSPQQFHINIEAHGVRLSAGSEYPIDKLTILLKEVVRSC